MAKEEKKSNENEARLPLGKINFVMMAVCLLLIVVGFALMTGSANDGTTFNESIFESRRTVVGPMVAFAGFVFMAFAIIYRKKDKNRSSQE
ncbi:MAG: DUF3098 domain-containing protein [Muribaculaceae bacterium]|nr:DUF3098 domain-containing protein [Muribaculaceae bacterium]